MLPTIVVVLLWTVVGVALAAALFTLYVCIVYSRIIERIFAEKPLLIADHGHPIADAETVELSSAGGRRVVGSFLRHNGERRRGVVLFLHEYGADRWLAVTYAGALREAGFDLFTIDFCGHGESESIPGYEPLHWPTEHEVADAQAAIDYLQSHEATKESGLALFGVSKGGGAALVAGGRNPFVRAIVTDGAFPVFGMLVHFMMKWIEVYSQSRFIYTLLPRWFYGIVGWWALQRISRIRRVRYPSVESSLRRLAGRPLLMIVGQRDSYVRKEIVDTFFEAASEPKELWRVKKAKHNGCLDAAGEEYHRKVREFLELAFPTIDEDATAGDLLPNRRAS